MKFPIAVVAGAVLAIVSSVAGVAAIQDEPKQGIKLYSYADK